MFFKPSFRRLQSLREEIVGFGMHLTGKSPGKTNREFLDFWWSTRVKAYEVIPVQKTEVHSRAGDYYSRSMQEYLQRLFFDWEKVRNALAERYIGLVRNIARRYGHPNQEFSDLVQEGSKGMLRAIDSYDVDYAVPFEAYAIPWIRKYISQMVQCKSELIRIPESAVKSRHISLKSITFTSDEELMERGDSPEDHLLRNNTCSFLGQCVDYLSDVQKKIIELRYLSNDSHVTSLESVGHDCGISRERARQLEHRALGTLKKFFNKSQKKF